MRMRRRQIPPGRIEQAVKWGILCNNKNNFDEDQQRELHKWVCKSEMNLVALIEVLTIDGRADAIELPERSIDPAGSMAVNSSDAAGHDTSPSPSCGGPVPPMLPPLPMSRRGLLGALVGTGGLVAAGAGVRVMIGMSEALRDGHVRRVSLDGAVMFVSRHTKFHIENTTSQQIVHISRGLIALHKRARSQRPVLLATPLGNVLVAAGEFVTLVEDTLIATVRSGRILFLDSAEPSEAGIVVDPGQRLTVRSGSTRVEPVAAVDVDSEFTWTDGVFFADNDRIGDVVTKLNRFSEVHIQPSPTVANMIVGHQRIVISRPREFVRAIVDEWDLVTHESDNRMLIFSAGETSARPRNSK